MSDMRVTRQRQRDVLRGALIGIGGFTVGLVLGWLVAHV